MVKFSKSLFLTLLFVLFVTNINAQGTEIALGRLQEFMTMLTGLGVILGIAFIMTIILTIFEITKSKSVFF